VGLADLGDVEPELMKGLQKLLAYDEAAPENGGASVADCFCLTFEVDWVEFDEVRACVRACVPQYMHDWVAHYRYRYRYRHRRHRLPWLTILFLPLTD